MKGLSRQIARPLAVIGLTALSLLGAQSAQAAGHEPLPPPAVAVAVAPGTSVTTTTQINGETIPVTFTAGAVQRTSTTLTASAVTSCWSANDSVSYGPSWARLMAFNQHVGWCGNGSTISSVGQQLYGSVTAYGQTFGWRYDGVTHSSETNYYNGWAYQEYGQGKFEECPIIHFACFISHYPKTTMNVYADGGYGWWATA